MRRLLRGLFLRRESAGTMSLTAEGFNLARLGEADLSTRFYVLSLGQPGDVKKPFEVVVLRRQ